MRMDLPLCTRFKDCRYNIDGNCKKDPKECMFTVMKDLLEEAAEEVENLYGRETELTEKIREII